jgi:NADH dehydrogenase/NADH:ubiquinone oxidoreductase subunit G
MLKKSIAVLLGAVALPAFASNCEMMNYQSGDVINVQTSSMLGTRIELPANLIKKPVITNGRLWDIGGETGSNQIMIAPNSEKKAGESTMVFAFTNDGKVYDILATRVENKDHQPCVIVKKRSKFVFVSEPKKVKPKPKTVLAATALENEKKAISKYQNQIFTRYKWNESTSFFGNETLSDIYDDGRSTFIRFNKPNQSDVTVQTKINGIKTMLPVTRNDKFLVKFSGVYSKFNVTVGDSKVSVTR